MPSLQMNTISVISNHVEAMMELQNHHFAAIEVDWAKNHQWMLKMGVKALCWTRQFYSSKYLLKITYYNNKFTEEKSGWGHNNQGIKDYVINNGTN